MCHITDFPYDPNSWEQLPHEVEYQIFGINARGLSNYLASKYRHETFDLLAGMDYSSRQRGDIIRDSVFHVLDSWLDNSPAENFITLSHKFFAHAADVGSLGSLKYSGIKLADVTSTQRAIIRVERAITDMILYVAEAREVVPMPPLGLFQKLEFPYAATGAVPDMQKMWDVLSKERNEWGNGISNDLLPSQSGTP